MMNRWLALLALWLLTYPLAAALAAEGEEDLEAIEAQVDRAVQKGLQYLAGRQAEDGSWPSGWGKNTGVTSLCVMAFMAAGHVPGRGPYGEVINKGIDFVLDSRQSDGMLVGPGRSHGPMYSHCIGTLMLCEVSGMVDRHRQERIDEALPRALEIILSAQQVEKLEQFRGGWRYQADSVDSDISATGWPLMALRSARNAGAEVPAKAIVDGLEFVMRCRTNDGGFGYQPGGGPGPARTGVALLCLELCGRHGDAAATAAGHWLLRHPPAGPNEPWFYYAVYYSAQGMYQLGDQFWRPFAAQLYRTLLQHQREDGSWVPGSAGREGECYSTAMAVLALCVPYCQLPIYQR